MNNLSSSPVVLITGAARGLGRAMALAFAKKGYAVGVNYVRNDKEADRTGQEIEKRGGAALLFKADVRFPDQVDAMFKDVSEKWGRLDVLVNNAGISRDRTLYKMTNEEWRDVLAVNLDGAFHCTRAALRLMRSRKNGSIINVSSYVAKRAVVGAGNYAVSKAGLVALTKSTALEEGPHNIRANAILPGFHVTDMNQEVWKKYEEQIRKQHLLPEMPDMNGLAEFAVMVAELKTVTGQVFAFESRLL